MNLVIVESPTKAKTISRFLGKNFQVESSYGHVRDLPKGDLGIDTEKNFEPRYVIPKKSQKNVNILKKLAKESDKIILATDEDREGEAIAWHLVQALGLNNLKSQKSKVKSIERIVFHEITKKAIEKALKNPRAINEDLVNAQQARRILDRLVGYKLSPFLWKKLMRGLSAGRVQSVALRLILDRENEIRNFIVQDYWTITALLQNKKKKEWESILVKINETAIPKPGLTNEKEVQKIIKELESSSWKIESIEKKEKEQQPRPPFITSTLQQTAWQRLRFSAKKTMVVAQQLYETGFITYMRTDSFNVSEEVLKSTAEFLKNNFGQKYALTQPRRFKTKSKGAQEAHEAIRPADSEILPESIKNDLSPDQYKLYNLIWKRFMATQMPNAIFNSTTIDTAAAGGKNKYSFQGRGAILKFDGFLKIYEMNIEEKILPDLDKEDTITAKEIKPEKHQTQPPARYNDASLVKALEKHGIGRPSTYAQIISTIQTRNYIEKDSAKRFLPTEIGEKVNKMLVENFPQIVDINFTANIENDLDKIAVGENEYARVIKNFYGPFEKNLEEKYQSVEKEDLTEETNEICDKCGKPMVIKHGRFGKFIACSGFPECRNTKQLPAKQLGIKCPLCKEGNVIERKTKRGRMFFGCSVWPKCEFASWQKPTGELCPECQSPLIELKNGIKCSSKSCRFTKD
ncbi:type I DNA topoisomerase [Patescibacteria group bacterium]|nr:type I DNA topoisomerase [Patescibacteria group bacterium]